MKTGTSLTAGGKVTHDPVGRRPRILVAVDMTFCDDAMARLRQAADVDYQPRVDQTTLEKIFQHYDGYLGHTNLRVTAGMLQTAARLKVICTVSTGTDHLDVEAIHARDIALLSLTTEYALLDRFTATAELAWGLLLACRRKIPTLFDRAKEGRIGLSPDMPYPRQLSGKTLGVIGLGRLGRMVAEYGKAFRMRVIACDVRKIDMPGVQQVDWETVLATADVITLHVHLRNDTRHMINKDSLAKMKPGVVIINTARGDLICEPDLLAALESGHVAAAGLDVVHDEWDPGLARHPIIEYARRHDNLILTPHVGGGSHESIVEARIFIAEKLADHLSTHTV